MKSQEIFNGFLTETNLRKRTFGLGKQAKNIVLNQDTVKLREINGYEEINKHLIKFSHAHETTYQHHRPLIMIANKVETSSETDTTLTCSSIRSDMPTVRRFSESSADELHKSEESLKKAIWNKNICRNGSLLGSSNMQALKKSTGYCPRYHNNDDEDGDNDIDAYGCCCYNVDDWRRHISDCIDIAIRVLLVFIFIYIESTKPFKRNLHPEEMWLYRNPRTPDIVSAWTLLLISIFAPLFVTIFIFWLSRDRRDFRAASWVWTLALGLNGLTTGLLKITVGRHRPDFFYRCFPDGIEVLNNATTSGEDIYICTGDIRQIYEGRKSFPSGHASFSFVAFGFISMYVGTKLHAFNSRGRGQSWRLCIAVIPLLLAALIAVSRTCDYHHHWEDVLTGSVIGLSITYLVYRQYYPPLTSKNCHRSYSRVCRRRRETKTIQFNTRKAVYERLTSEEDINDIGNNDDNGGFTKSDRRRLI